jgi:hypothetical protein
VRRFDRSACSRGKRLLQLQGTRSEQDSVDPKGCFVGLLWESIWKRLCLETGRHLLNRAAKFACGEDWLCAKLGS